MTTRSDRLVKNMLEDWKRSMLTFWVLGLLLQHSMYGLEIKREIEASTQGSMKLGAGTIYQLLHRLESRDLVTRRWKKTEQGPPRAYFDLTAAGHELIYRYAREVLSPDSRIASALEKLTAQILRHS